MSYTFKELKHKTAAELKEIASGIKSEAVQGYTQMHKEQLIEAICKALGIDTYEHHAAKGINKTRIKSEIKALKKERDRAIEVHDHKELKDIRRKMKKLKNQLRKTAVQPE